MHGGITHYFAGDYSLEVCKQQLLWETSLTYFNLQCIKDDLNRVLLFLNTVLVVYVV